MKTFISILIVLVLGLGVWFIAKDSKPESEVMGVTDQTNNITNTETVNNTNTTTPQTTTTTDNKKYMNATLHTTKGDITIEFFDKEAPNTVANFQKLAKAGFYDGVKFHRVIKGFMDQTGDPLSKDDTKMAMWGTGGPGYAFADEIDPNSALYKQTGYKVGIVAMANSGPNTNGSQFFIMAVDYPLPPSYTIFGKVDAGLDVVTAINTVKTDSSDRPIDPVSIKSITLK